MESCCTCAALLSSIPSHSTKSEKPYPEDRRLECCGRVICGLCIHKNPRFASYCPYCQISSTPTTLPQGLKEPPSYASATGSSTAMPPYAEAPPPYTPTSIPLRDPHRPPGGGEKAAPAAADGRRAEEEEDILHFLNHEHDTIQSLSLRYGVPAPVLRRTNKLAADHLLLARRTVLIPGGYYKGGVSLSPRSVEGEEEELRKSNIRRWMVGCKNADYDIAVLYLEQAGYDLAGAMEAYFADEAWELEHPLAAKARGKGKGPSSTRVGTWARHAAFLRRQAPSGLP